MVRYLFSALSNEQLQGAAYCQHNMRPTLLGQNGLNELTILVKQWLMEYTLILGSVRAATNILTKIRNFRDLRTCQKGPKSDQKGT